MKIMTIAGTRPEIIRLAATIKKLDEYFEHRFIHTGQNTSANMRDIFFDDLDLREPDEFWNIVSNGNLSEMIGGIMQKLENEIREHKPAGLVVLGDTNSAIATIIARRMGVVVYHIEAGNRSFDENVPEEVNRRIIDHFADFNLVYSRNALQNLLDEGLNRRRILMCGSPMAEVIESVRSKIENSQILSKLGLESEQYILVSAHRQENVDSLDRLTTLVASLGQVSEYFKKNILVSLHPRTKSKIEQSGIKVSGSIIFHEPFGFVDYLKLQTNAYVVLSDSGTISEEATILGFPAVTIRDSMERQEALEVGGMVLTGIEFDNIRCGIQAVKSNLLNQIPEAYGSLDHSEIVTRYIISTISRAKNWMGIR